jgi:hypothetical protein
MAHQSLQAQTNGLGIGVGAGGRFRLTEEFVVKMKRLFHMYDYAIEVWREEHYFLATPVGGSAAPR